jgi:hypothetical protein
MLLLPLAALMMPTRRKSGRAIRRACLALACVAILAA